MLKKERKKTKEASEKSIKLLEKTFIPRKISAFTINVKIIGRDL